MKQQLIKLTQYFVPDFALRYFLKLFYRFKAEKLTLSSGVRLGRNITFGRYNRIFSDTKISNSSFGDFTYIANDSCINNVDIGKFCSFGPGVRTGMGIHPTTMVSTHPIFYSTLGQSGVVAVKQNFFSESKRTHIGSDVWIGANVIIHDGVVIGDGAIIASGSVVNKDINPYSIVAGVPAKIIKYRFSERIIDKLLRKAWWDDATLSYICKYHQDFHDIQRFLTQVDD
jgi:acetyltransferase-like isoleucine patch superfamily enzyme